MKKSQKRKLIASIGGAGLLAGTTVITTVAQQCEFSNINSEEGSAMLNSALNYLKDYDSNNDLNEDAILQSIEKTFINLVTSELITEMENNDSASANNIGVFVSIKSLNFGFDVEGLNATVNSLLGTVLVDNETKYFSTQEQVNISIDAGTFKINVNGLETLHMSATLPMIPLDPSIPGEDPSNPDTTPLVPLDPSIPNIPVQPGNPNAPIAPTQWGTGFSPFYDASMKNESNWGNELVSQQKGQFLDITQFDSAYNQNNFTAAFINAPELGTKLVGTMAGTAEWDQAKYASPEQQIIDANLQGKNITLSFGGAAGIPLWIKAVDGGHSQNELNVEMLRLVNKFGARSVDYDIEGSNGANDGENGRINSGIKMLVEATKYLRIQKPDLKVSLTLPVLGGRRQYGTPGLQTLGGLPWLNMFMEGIGTTFVTNAMAMDAGAWDYAPYLEMGKTGGGQFVIDAITAVKNQVMSAAAQYGNALTEEQAWALTGATPMIGVNDMPEQILYPEGWQMVVDWAKDKQIGMLSYWSALRDQYGAGFDLYRNSELPGLEAFTFLDIALGRRVVNY